MTLVWRDLTAGIAPCHPPTAAEAAFMDPQQRLLLEAVSESLLAGGGALLQVRCQTKPQACADGTLCGTKAGRAPAELHAAISQPLPRLQRPEAVACGVFVGVSFEDYNKLAFEAQGLTTYTATGTAGSVVSGRLSYSFGLRGPALSIDTGRASAHLWWHGGALQGGRCCQQRQMLLVLLRVAAVARPSRHSATTHAAQQPCAPCCTPSTRCATPKPLCLPAACSSSLVSVHMAFNGMRLRQCGTASASGINLILHPNTSAIAQKAGMLTPDGRCKALSAAADGYGRAEACITMLLMPSGAVGSGSTVATLAGSAVNQDGRSSSLTAPNGPAQQEVMRMALAVAGLAASSVAALSMHGTGTRVERGPCITQCCAKQQASWQCLAAYHPSEHSQTNPLCHPFLCRYRSG